MGITNCNVESNDMDTCYVISALASIAYLPVINFDSIHTVIQSSSDEYNFLL